MTIAPQPRHVVPEHTPGPGMESAPSSWRGRSYAPAETGDPASEETDATSQDEKSAAETESAETPSHRSWWTRRRETRHLEGQFTSYPHLLAIKPARGYVFHSDYFEVDDSVATILAYVHDDAAHDTFLPFWGIDRIPDLLPEGVTTVVQEKTERMTDAWIESHIRSSERLDSVEANDAADSQSAATRRRTATISTGVEQVIGQIQDGASYLSIQTRLLVKAPSLEVLDESVERITRLCIDRFGTLKTAPYAGEQRRELSDLLSTNDRTKGAGFHFTSTELAGSYSLVTNGINDPGGEYVGYMVGDVNNSAVLLDADKYTHHVVVADGAVSEYLDRAQVSDMWCSKLAQSCLLHNGSVVHLVLDGADLDRLGPRFAGLSSTVDLGRGEINMFEMFGDPGDELAVFATQMSKLKLMVGQLHESDSGDDRSILEGALEKALTDFYVDQGMWTPNAQLNRERLRVVGIPHDQVPRLQMFVSYLETAYKAVEASMTNYEGQVRAYDVLRSVARSMLSTNGDLFNNPTSSGVDSVRNSRRVVYNLSELARRSQGVAMAQLVNVLGFAISELGPGDTVIVHGAENIDSRVKDYVFEQFEHLWHRGGRVVFSYNNVDRMIADQEFNLFDAADYTVLGSMRDKSVDAYQKALAQRIPPDLTRLLTARQTGNTYLRRGVTNIVFHTDLALGINPERAAQRREAAARAAQVQADQKVHALMDPDGHQVAGASLTSKSNSTMPIRDRQHAEARAERAERRAARHQRRNAVGRRGVSPTSRQTQTSGKKIK